MLFHRWIPLSLRSGLTKPKEATGRMGVESMANKHKGRRRADRSSRHDLVIPSQSPRAISIYPNMYNTHIYAVRPQALVAENKCHNPR